MRDRRGFEGRREVGSGAENVEGMLKSMQQQIGFLEKKIDMLISKLDGGQPSHQSYTPHQSSAPRPPRSYDRPQHAQHRPDRDSQERPRSFGKDRPGIFNGKPFGGGNRSGFTPRRKPFRSK